MSKNCSQCQTGLNPGAKFCLQCGTPVAGGSAPENIAMPDSGGYIAPPSAPEPDSVWQPGAAGQAAPPQAPQAPQAPQVGGPTPQQVAWQPEGPPSAGPPPAHPPYVDGGAPQFDQAHLVEPEKSGGGFGKLAAVGLGVVGVGAVAFLAFRFIAGGDGLAGGASSPEDVATEMVEAINAKDPLAAVALMAPDELDGLSDIIEDTASLYEDLGLDDIVEEQSDARDIDIDIEIDIEIDDIEVSMEGDRAAIVSFELSGDAAVNGVGDAGFANIDVSFDSRDLEDALPNGSDAVEMIVVQLDGKWYASPMLTAGHYIVENGDLPSGDYDQIGEDRDPGAGSAEEAIEALVDVINDPDADALAAVLGGGEGRVAVAFRDAIDEGFSEIDSSEVRYELSVETEDIGSGRVELVEINFEGSDDFSDFEATVEDGCISIREDGQRSERECIADALDVDDDDIDTSIWLDTVEEDGARRVRIVPTITNVYGRFFDLIDDRQTALFLAEIAYLDIPTEVSTGSDIDIEFDGQRYTVHEFEIEEGEAYNVAASNDTRFDVWIDDGLGWDRSFRDSFVARHDGVARVVTYSEVDDEFDCMGLGCVPSGDGETTLRIREGARQSVPFPTVLSGELGPGDVRVFELEVTESEFVTITVDGNNLDWRILDDFDISEGGDAYTFTPGTYELVLTNWNGDESVSYTVTPTSN